MRYILIFWAAPMSFFWGWYFVSLNGSTQGTGFFSRRMHDLVFNIYGDILGMDPSVIPGHVARACIFDTFLIFGIVAFRKRRQIIDYVRSLRPTDQDAPREIA
jgi:hypothetical protein